MNASPTAALDLFHPVVRDWFLSRFAAPTGAQALGWAAIAEGRDVLVSAPTGSGKTLAAFLASLDRLLRRAVEGTVERKTSVVYVSPLRALAGDIHRNLESPLAELLVRAGLEEGAIEAQVRTGDTTPGARQRMVRRPPHLLVTTPESLYLLLTSPRARETLRAVETVIVDEVHALAPDRRGAHLALSLERLEALCDRRPVRIGLSATARPLEEIARFLVGGAEAPTVVDAGHLRELDLAIEVPREELGAVCTHEQWAEVYERMVELIEAHSSTLVFVNTRRLAERVAHQLAERLGEGAVLPHHGSLSHKARRRTETDLKEGRLKAVVATASLELGIDVGYVDLVCQIGSPRSIATFLQRVGRSGHGLGRVPKGRLFALTRDELLEGLALLEAARRGELDVTRFPRAPVDVLAQQIAAEVACRDWEEAALWERFRRAAPYRSLGRDEFGRVVEMLAEGVAGRRGGRRTYVHRDQVHGMLRARRGTRLTAITGGGAIPETGEYRVVVEGGERTVVGTLDEDFAVESQAGDIFLLGNRSWMIRYIRGGEVVVSDAGGAPPSVPFWLGEGPGRTAELSASVSGLRRRIERMLPDAESAALALAAEGFLSSRAAEQAVRYVEAQVAATGFAPTQERVLVERFFDEAGGMQLVVHAPFGSKVNRAWGLALRKRFCRSFNFELQAAADDDGIVLSLGPQHSFPLGRIAELVPRAVALETLVQAVLAVPFFGVRWRWNATRALFVQRWERGRRVPFPIQRVRAEDILSAVFPASTACLENVVGDIEVPDHPLVKQAMDDCLYEAMDYPGFEDVLARIEDGRIQVVGLDTTEPSPFSHQRLNSNPYTFLDDAPLEERRARAVSDRRTLDPQSVRDLGSLDPEAILRGRADAWPLVRDAEELNDALLAAVVIPAGEAREWTAFFGELRAAGRAAAVETGAGPTLWVAAERVALARAIWPGAILAPDLATPPSLRAGQDPDAAASEVVRGRLEIVGPVTQGEIARDLGLAEPLVRVSLVELEGEGLVLRGRFRPGAADEEWCERRLLARIHRLTLEGLRRRVQPVPVEQYVRFLFRHQHLDPMTRLAGPEGLAEALAGLEGFEAAAGDWESRILPARLDRYDPAWLDLATQGGRFLWLRLSPSNRDPDKARAMRPLGRSVALSFADREHLSWLVRDPASTPAVGSIAASIARALEERGAQFVPPLLARLAVLPDHAEDALAERGAAGLATADGFQAVRRLMRRRRDRERLARARFRREPDWGGRWTLVSAERGEPASDEARLEGWCALLVRRWGVVFRDLLARESVAPPWRDLVRTFRRLEGRGVVRGGRFVASVGGEQYAASEAIEPLRAAAEPVSDAALVVLAATDPLNLYGRLLPGPKIPAAYGNRIAVAAGRLVAYRAGGSFEPGPEPMEEAERARLEAMLGA